MPQQTAQLCVSTAMKLGTSCPCSHHQFTLSLHLGYGRSCIAAQTRVGKLVWVKINQLKCGVFYSLNCFSEEFESTFLQIQADRELKGQHSLSTFIMGEKVQDNYIMRPAESLATSTGTDRRSAQISLVLGSLATLSAFGRERK